MVKIYCIQDCNNLKYVGSTRETLKKRLSKHKINKRYRPYCSSEKLNLDNCKIYVLEETDEEHRMEREKYWIHTIDCVNVMRYDFDEKEYLKEYQKEYRQKNKDKKKEYREKNRDNYLQYEKEYREKNRYEINEYKKQRYHYRKSFGGDERRENNLLLIDIDLFL